MKHFFALFIIATLLIGCNSQEDNLILSGSVKGLVKGTLYLEQLRDTVLVAVDSVAIDGDSNFSMSLYVNEPEVHYLYVAIDASELNDERLPIFLEPGEIQVHTKLQNLMSEAQVTGSQNHTIWKEYTKNMSRFTNQRLELIRQTIEAQQAQNDSLAMALSRKQDAVLRTKYLATVNFARNNADKAIAPYLLLSETVNLNTKYLDTVYKVLAPEVQTSVYGKQLAALIKERSSLQ
ncbi:MAG: DUF4369 domain-containing protein [Gilvibacter sp.]